MYPFRYCTIQQAKSYSGSEDSDQVILQRIELWSEIINQITEKWFVPVYFNGQIEQLYDDRFVMPNKVPIIEMSEPVEVEFSPMGGKEDVEFITDLTGLESIDAELEAAQSSDLEDYSRLYDRISVVGYFGWLNHKRSKVTATVTQSAAEGSNEITLDSNTEINSGDVVLIDNYISAIVCEVCDDNVRIIVDPIAESIQVDDEVIVFGRVPRDIAFCTQELIAKKGGSLQDQMNTKFQQMLVSETTDNYTYRLSDPGASAYGANSMGTGITEVDRILSRYRTNADVRLV